MCENCNPYDLDPTRIHPPCNPLGPGWTWTYDLDEHGKFFWTLSRWDMMIAVGKTATIEEAGAEIRHVVETQR